MEIKGHIRIPTREYAYIELEVDGSVESIIDLYFEANDYYFRKQNKKFEQEEPFVTQEVPHVGLGPTPEQILEGIRNKKLNK